MTETALVVSASICSAVAGGLSTRIKGRGVALGAILGMAFPLIGMIVAMCLPANGNQRSEAAELFDTNSVSAHIDTVALTCAGIAIAWTAALIPASFFVAIFAPTSGPNFQTDTTVTLVGLLGPGAAWVVFLPLAGALLACVGIYGRSHGARMLATALTWIVIALFAVLVFLGAFTIGPVLLPVPILLAIATARTAVGPRADHRIANPTSQHLSAR